MTGRAACSNRETLTALAFDTYKAVKALQAAGADEPLAEAVVATVGEAVSGNVATKADLAEVQAGLETDIATVKTELKTEIAEVKTEIAAVKTEIAEVKTELKTEIVTLRGDMLKSQQDMSNSIHGVYRLMVVAILTITSTIIGAAIVLVRYLAP